MNILMLQDAFLGIVQGITEFLPISSSAHLVLIPYLFNWSYQGLQFDVALHLGSVIAIVLFFARDWIKIFKNAFTTSADTEYPKGLLWYILIATIPAGISGFLLKDYEEKYLHFPLLLAINLAAFGIIILLVDYFAKRNLKISDIKGGGTFIVGIAQAFALIPGVSRSGITMTAGRAIGLSREESARFSFLLGAPAMIGAFLVEIPKLLHESIGISFWIGVIFSAISAFIAIKFLLQYLSKKDFKIFAIYRFILAAIVIAVYLLR